MLFNVWSPAISAPDEVMFDVTRANMPRVGSGDAEWIAACLEAIGVTAAARTWSVEAGRCYFYSDYTDETEWEDRWIDTWIVHVELDGGPPADFGPPDPLPKVIDRNDGTWTDGAVDGNHDRNALLLLLIRGAEPDAARIRDELLALLPPDLPPAQTRTDRAGPDWTRVRITVTGALFPDRVEALEGFLEQCRQRQVIVNRNELD